MGAHPRACVLARIVVTLRPATSNERAKSWSPSPRGQLRQLSRTASRVAAVTLNRSEVATPATHAISPARLDDRDRAAREPRHAPRGEQVLQALGPAEPDRRHPVARPPRADHELRPQRGPVEHARLGRRLGELAANLDRPERHAPGNREHDRAREQSQPPRAARTAAPRTRRPTRNPLPMSSIAVPRSLSAATSSARLAAPGANPPAASSAIRWTTSRRSAGASDRSSDSETRRPAAHDLVDELVEDLPLVAQDPRHREHVVLRRRVDVAQRRHQPRRGSGCARTRPTRSSRPRATRGRAPRSRPRSPRA